MPAVHTIHFQIASAYTRLVSRPLLRAAARAALAQQAARAPGELTLIIAGDARLRQLNRTYLGHDRPTDVLSFAADTVDPATGARYFGDILISLPRARAQAKAGGHPLAAELQLLVVHGVLHLLGHDHATPRQKARMWAAQAKILTQLKAPLTAPASE